MGTCDNCCHVKECGGRSSDLPRETTLQVSKCEENRGEKKPHHLTSTREIGIYSPGGESGDGCRVIQELVWGDQRYLRLGYYIRNPDKDTWRWGESAPIISENELQELLSKAKRDGLIGHLSL
jgi:hypothetical protein